MPVMKCGVKVRADERLQLTGCIRTDTLDPMLEIRKTDAFVQ